ncbi:hypothetical protein [Robertmurraya andreesenii]|uniref:Uncharacterized protein n=1 Tax=Anoxybacillus andreesenii TaxID=1325932 RepID=A0ABT9V6G0_9BACL|nr:hypothetical protein [Robertmurraya andreesenii]MDQ0156531.1 hypothetical protein [Robertmurraya andreesenii]
MNCFLAVCKDRPNDPKQFFYTIYFVNNTNLIIEEIFYETGAFMSEDDDLIETSRHKRNLGKIASNDFVEVETADEGTFDFEIDFSFKMKFSTGKVVNKAFSIGKYLRNATKSDSIPVLLKAGYTIKER